MVERVTGAVRAALTAAADPTKAPAMQRYMKSETPFLGVQAPSQKQIVRAALSTHPLRSAAGWRAAVDGR